MKTSYVDMQIEAIAEAEDISVKEAAQLYQDNSEHIVELDNLPKQNHIWTDRGLKYTCENAGHASHEAWKRRRSL